MPFFITILDKCDANTEKKSKSKWKEKNFYGKVIFHNYSRSLSGKWKILPLTQTLTKLQYTNGQSSKIFLQTTIVYSKWTWQFYLKAKSEKAIRHNVIVKLFIDKNEKVNCWKSEKWNNAKSPKTRKNKK